MRYENEMINKYRYNTPMEISRLLISLLPERKYKSIIDICCGSWNLVNAAYNRFREGEYTGIDIDGESEQKKPQFAHFIKQDGRIFALNNEKKYDLILSNPPYGYLSDKERLYESLKGKRVFDQLKRKRYECEMIQANLLLGKNNAVYLFVLPITILEGTSFAKFRTEIKENYNILNIIELPRNAFGGKNISTFAVILTKKTAGEVIGCRFFIDPKMNIAIRTKDNNSNVTEIRRTENDDSACKIEVFRGCISSSQINNKKGRLVYHCSANWIEDRWIPRRGYCSDEDLLRRCRKVKKGDIIINRIGHNVGAWCVIKKGGYISDCLIAVSSENDEEIVEIVQRNSENQVIRISPRGVAVQYLTIGDVRELLEREYDRQRNK